MKYLGIDFGLRRIGLATSEGSISAPLKILEVKNFHDGLEKIEEVIKKEGIEKIIIGLPEGKMGQTVKGFVKSLEKKGFEVEVADETLSSKKALESAIILNASQKKRRFNDDLSAAIILQDYLDNK